MYFYSGNIAKHFAHFIDKRESRVNDNVHSTLGFSSRGSVGTTKESCLDPGQIFPLTSECPGTSPQHTLVALLARFDIISTMRYKFTILTFCDFSIGYGKVFFEIHFIIQILNTSSKAWDGGRVLRMRRLLPLWIQQPL
uniref:Uncharacterized protein n=1 Tax=Cacopsylla melanoneura TaxID=428564 RepID=A0A8D8ZAJ8_9HEMI